jgi:hypothetical protein
VSQGLSVRFSYPIARHRLNRGRDVRWNGRSAVFEPTKAIDCKLAFGADCHSQLPFFNQRVQGSSPCAPTKFSTSYQRVRLKYRAFGKFCLHSHGTHTAGSISGVRIKLDPPPTGASLEIDANSLHNRLVGGSSPPGPTNKINILWLVFLGGGLVRKAFGNVYGNKLQTSIKSGLAASAGPARGLRSLTVQTIYDLSFHS